jgi:hypothetical protein
MSISDIRFHRAVVILSKIRTLEDKKSAFDDLADDWEIPPDERDTIFRSIIASSIYSRKDWEVASDLSFGNRDQVQKSGLAGCYYCRQVYRASEVEEYIDVNDKTAVCPRCGIDAVLGDASGLPITNTDYMRSISIYAFGSK